MPTSTPRHRLNFTTVLLLASLLSTASDATHAQQTSNSLISQGNAAAMAGDCGQAIDYYRQAFSQGSTDATLVFNFAVCLEREGDTQQAVSMYQRFVDVHPTADNVEVARGKMDELTRRREPDPEESLPAADLLWRQEIGASIHRLVNQNYADVSGQLEMSVAYRILSYSHGQLTTVETTHFEGDLGWNVASCSAQLSDLDFTRETAESGPFPGGLWIGCSGAVADCFSCQQFSQDLDSPFLASSSLDRGQASIGTVVGPESREQGKQIIRLLRRLQSAQ